MLKVRVIPTLLWKEVGLVKGVGFDSGRRIGSLMPAIKVYNQRDVDELILLDVGSTLSNREPDYGMIEEAASESFFPLTVGGGVDSLDKIRRLLRAGADKVTVNTAAHTNPTFIRQAAEKFGSQCVVVSVDVKPHSTMKYECYSHCGQRPTGRDPVQWVETMVRCGAGEILVTSIALDGTMKGYDLQLTKAVTENVDVPVIASGGAGSYQHMYEALTTGGASAVAAASMFHFTEQTPAEGKRYLAERGIPVRDSNANV